MFLIFQLPNGKAKEANPKMSADPSMHEDSSIEAQYSMIEHIEEQAHYGDDSDDEQEDFGPTLTCVSSASLRSADCSTRSRLCHSRKVRNFTSGLGRVRRSLHSNASASSSGREAGRRKQLISL